MTNAFEYRCPNCRNTGQIDICASIWVRLTRDGTDADASGDGNHTWEADSPAVCRGCGFQGKAAAFDPAVLAQAPKSPNVRHPIFIHLLHGRDEPDEDMHDWGFTGPILGPFECVHVTYRDHFRCIRSAETGEEIELRFHDDLLVHDGKFYGDYEICGGHAVDSPGRPRNPFAKGRAS